MKVWSVHCTVHRPPWECGGQVLSIRCLVTSSDISPAARPLCRDSLSIIPVTTGSRSPGQLRSDGDWECDSTNDELVDHSVEGEAEYNVMF